MSNNPSPVLKNVMLFAPTIGYWRGLYQLPEDGVVVSMDDEELPVGTRTAARVKLITDKYPLDPAGEPWLDSFRAVETAQKRIINRYSLPFPIRGVRIVPKAAGEAFLTDIFGRTYGGLQAEIREARRNGQAVTRLERDAERVRHEDPEAADNPYLAIFDTRKTAEEEQSIAYQLRDVARRFTSDIDRIIPQIREAVGEKQWAAVQGRIPRGKDMRRKFHMDLVPVEIADGRSRELSTADLGAHRALVEEALHNKIVEAVDTMTEAPRLQLAQALHDIRELINNGGRVTARSFGPIRAAIEKIRMFEFVADRDLLARLNDMEQQLEATRPQSLTEPGHIRDEFLAVVQDVTTQATHAAQHARVSEGRRQRFRNLDLS